MSTVYLFHETLIVNEAQVPPTGLLCEVQAGEMVTWKDFIYYQLCSIMKVSYAHQICLYWIKNTETSNIVKYYYHLKNVYLFNILKINLFMWCKLNCRCPSLLQSSVHDPSEIIIICWFIINIGNSCATYFYFIYLLLLNNFLEPLIPFWNSLINKK